MNIKIYNDDCFNVFQEMMQEDVKVDLVLTDPPYSITQCKWDTNIDISKMWKCLKKITHQNTPILLFGNEPFSSNLRLSQPS